MSCEGADGLACIDGWLYSSVNMMIFPTNKKCPTCAVAVDDACVRDETKLCECWVRLANGVNCPLAPDVPNVIQAYPVASFQCPKCDMVMVRESNTYSCISPNCELNGVKYKPVPWEMERVDG
jgi:hypothetical protein